MRALSARRVRPVFIAALALLSALAFASTAHAGTMTFSSPFPAANATGVSGWPNVSVRVQSTAAIPLPRTMLVDGLPVTCYGYYAEVSGHLEYDPNLEEDVWVVDEWDYTDLTLYSLGAMLTDTVHTAQVDWKSGKVTLRNLGEYVRVAAEDCAEQCGSLGYLEPVLVERGGACQLLRPHSR